MLLHDVKRYSRHYARKPSVQIWAGSLAALCLLAGVYNLARQIDPHARCLDEQTALLRKSWYAEVAEQRARDSAEIMCRKNGLRAVNPSFS